MGSTGRRFLVYGGGLIALYLVLYHASGAGTLLTSAGPQVTGTIRAFQGR